MIRDKTPQSAEKGKDRRHRNTMSTSAVPELEALVNARPDPKSNDSLVELGFSGPYFREAEALRESGVRYGAVSPAALPSPGASLYAVYRPAVKPTRKRWLMLFYLSALALLSDWICFAAAPIAPLIARNFRLHDSHLVSCFLATNVVFCLLEPSVVRRVGLRGAVVGGAVAMAVGCVFRSLASELAVTSGYAAAGLDELSVGLDDGAPGGSDDDDAATPLDTAYYAPAYLVVAGTMLVGAAQPFFQCTPSLLAANWFGDGETTLAATVALNSNQLGIALAYAVGAGLVRSDGDLAMYNRCLAALATLLAFGCSVHFASLPSRAPSAAALLAKQRERSKKERRRDFEGLRRTNASPSPTTVLSHARRQTPRRRLARWMVQGRQVGKGALDLTVDLWTSLRELAKVGGFRGCVVAFVASIVTSNLVSTFLPHLVYEGESRYEPVAQRGAVQRRRVAGLGAGFQVCILAGSVGFGSYVDASKRYKAATAAALAGTVAALLAVARDETTRASLDGALLLLGFLVGPVQPLAAELAVETTHPDGDENTIVALMQTAGNLASACAVPLFLSLQKAAAARGWEARYDLRVEYFALAAAVAAAGAVFAAQLRGAALGRVAANASAANTPTFNQALEDAARRPKYLSG